MSLWSLALVQLRRRPARTALTICGLALAVATVVALVGVAQRFEESFLELYQRQGYSFVVQRVGGNERLNSGLDETLGTRIAALPHVRRVVAGMMDVVSLEQHGLYAVMVNGWPSGSPVVERVKLRAGRKLQPGDRGQVMLGRILAENTGKTVGDSLEIYGEPFQVAGVFESFSVYENGAAFLPLAELQRLTARPGQVTGYVVQIDEGLNDATRVQLARQIESLAPAVAATPTAEFVSGLAQINMSRTAAWVISAVAVGIGLVGLLNTMGMSVLERSREIGLLRALGWRRSRIARLVLLEALWLCLAGSLLGGTLAVVAVAALARLPATNGLIDGKLPSGVLIVGLVASIVVGLIGALYPAWWAAQRTPQLAIGRP